MKTTGRTLTLGICTLIFAASAAAQSTPQPLPLLQGRPDQSDDAPLTGPVFNDPLQGIALAPPADAETHRQSLAVGDFVEFVNKDSGWALKVSRAELPQPIPLSDSSTGKQGLLELTAERFMASSSTAKILRQEVTHIGKTDCGILMARYTQGAQPRLMQQAILRADDRVYYVLTMTSPAGPQERHATRTFAAVLQSVHLIDRSKIREDQNQRLLRVRAFYAALTPEKIRQFLVPQEFDRITQNGRDVGYRYVVESTEKRFGLDGIRIGIRQHLEPAGAPQVDREAWLTCAFSRKEEEWSRATRTTDLKGAKTAVSELGTSTRYSRDIFDPIHGVADPKDPGQPRVRTEIHYVLNVTRITAAGTGKPIERQLPPFYAPQALGFLLPEMLARLGPNTYMFATWDDNQQQVVMRYLDVGSEQPVDLDGKIVHAIPVEDRLGLEGPMVIHYIQPNGLEIATRFDNNILCVQTDRATLLSIYKNANLTPPGDSSR